LTTYLLDLLACTDIITEFANLRMAGEEGRWEEGMWDRLPHLITYTR
jgi:hypothetical protein